MNQKKIQKQYLYLSTFKIFNLFVRMRMLKMGKEENKTRRKDKKGDRRMEGQQEKKIGRKDSKRRRQK